jgi:hypothetical protein
MPAKTNIKAKRTAIAKAYGCLRVEDDMDGFYYSRRHLAKLPDADEHGWHELKYQDEEADLVDAIEKTLRGIRDRDGMKFYREVAQRLLENIAINVEAHGGPKALRRELDRAVTRRAGA